MSVPYPQSPAERDRWIKSRRLARNPVDPFRPYGVARERELDASGEVVPVLTVFLTNRECPWHCLMCDLWKNTLTGPTPIGAIPAQIDWALQQTDRSSAGALAEVDPPGHIKLYNSGSFFDPRAIPPEEYPAIAARLKTFGKVIVECHPSLVDDSVLGFRDLLDGKLEVAMGLETANPEILERLNKRMTLDQFARAARFLRTNDIDVRVFVLVKPPFLDEGEALHWARRSMEFAFDSGASVVSLIPTRFGNGAMESLAARGEFSPPRLELLEEAARYGVQLRRGRVFADLWDLKQFSECDTCFPARQDMLTRLNLSQRLEAPWQCSSCGVGQVSSN